MEAAKSLEGRKTSLSSRLVLKSSGSPGNNPKKAELRPVEEGEDLKKYLEKMTSIIYKDYTRANGENGITHSIGAGELAAESVLQPFDYYERCIGLCHDSVEDTYDKRLKGEFPFKMQFEDPQFSHENPNGRQPRYSNPQKNVYYWDGLLHKSGPVGRSLIRSWEVLYRSPERGNYLSYIQRILNINLRNNPNLEHDVLTAIFKTLGDRRHNAYTELNLPLEIIDTPREEAVKKYKSGLEFFICEDRVIRNIIDDLQIYLPTIEQSLINLDKETQEMREPVVGDQIYDMDIIKGIIANFKKYQQHKRGIIEESLGQEKWAKFLGLATSNGGGLRENSTNFPELKMELADSEIRYMYLRPGLDHYVES